MTFVHVQPPYSSLSLYTTGVSTSTMEVSAAIEVSTSTMTALFFCLIAAASKQALLFLLGRAIDV
ncbi:hypothetical protein BDZ91DRAFT_736526 [Kalaharituber pfeilii]|nr:hypothetical protein BDZ91DRAFT_736526 [Kalaharituber pfeilii]